MTNLTFQDYNYDYTLGAGKLSLLLLTCLYLGISPSRTAVDVVQSGPGQAWANFKFLSLFDQKPRQVKER